jgi:hypothetical protein
MKIIKWMGILAACFAMASCGGGGGDAGTSPLDPDDDDDGGSTVQVQAVEVVASSTELASSGETITITAIVKGAGNVALANTPVSITADTGSLTAASATTDAGGVATATFSAGTGAANKTNRTATITATAGGESASVDVAIVGTSVALSGPTTVAQGDSVSLAVLATDADGNPIANLPLSVDSSLGNTVTLSSATTNAQGGATITYTATTSGSDTITVTGGGDSDESAMTVSGEDFEFFSPDANTQIEVGDTQTVSVRYRLNGVPQAGVLVNFATTAGQLSANSATTNAQGEASVDVSSLSAVAATLQATFTQGATTASATLPLQFVATTPAAVVLQVTPSALGPNLGGSVTNQAQVKARVTDANGNPVANRTVNFSRDTDPSGGNLSQPSATTNLNGEATVQYISGAQSTQNNGVVLRATVQGTAITDTTTLTVNQSALFIALGTGNTITNIDEQTYRKNYVVYVTDANGVPVNNVTLTLRALPEQYGKGTLAWNGTSWDYDTALFCNNEDQNRDGQIDTVPDEDANNNDTLEPGNVIAVTPGTIQTDATGRATISLIYAESYAKWVRISLLASATVSGTESTKEVVFTVVGSSADFTNENIPPAGVISPFGTNLSCTNPN